MHNVAKLCLIYGDKLYVGDNVTKPEKTVESYE